MSVKIHEAYVIKPKQDVWQVLMEIKTKARKTASEALWKFYLALIAGTEPEVQDEGVALTSPLEASRYVRDKFYASSKTAYPYRWDIWALDTAISVRRVGRRYLLIPYPGNGCLSKSLEFLRKHPALADFHYQNSSDRPKNISAREWRLRDRTWEQSWTDEDRWREYATLEIVSLSVFPVIDPAWDGKYISKWLKQQQAKK